MKIRIMFFLIILLGLTISACNTSGTDSSEEWQTYENRELGIRLEFPNTWALQEVDDVITIAIDQQTLDNGISDGAGASITPATREDFNGLSEPRDIMGLFIDYFENGRPDLERISEPEFITIQGQSAARVQYNGTVRDQSGVFTATIITNEDRIALILAVNGSQDEQYQQVLDRIAQSVTVFTPTR